MLTEPIVLDELHGILKQVRDGRLLSVTEAARELDIEPAEAKRLVRRGVLPTQTVAGRIVIEYGDLLQFELRHHLRTQRPNLLPDIV